MPIAAEHCGVGHVEHTVDGLTLRHPVVLCCPGDWPALKGSLDDPEAWSTSRLGLLLVAVGPPSGDAVDALRCLGDRDDPADRVGA